MKIAAISDDGVTISQHFGRAPYYVVVTVEDGKVVAKERRDKAGHHSFASEDQASHAPGERHGYDPASQDRHARMAISLGDCQVLLAGGMGWGAYDSLKERGVQPIITDIKDIDAAVAAYLDGTIRDLAQERLH